MAKKMTVRRYFKLILVLSVSLEKELRTTQTSQRKVSYTKKDPNLESVSEFISFLSYTIIASKCVKIVIIH